MPRLINTSDEGGFLVTDPLLLQENDSLPQAFSSAALGAGEELTLQYLDVDNVFVDYYNKDGSLEKLTPTRSMVVIVLCGTWRLKMNAAATSANPNVGVSNERSEL